MLQRLTAPADHPDKLIAWFDQALARCQEFLCPRGRRDPERQQRAVPAVLQVGEDRVELLVRNPLRKLLRNPGPIPALPLAPERLERVVMLVRPPATPEPVQRKQIHQRAVASHQVQVVERPAAPSRHALWSPADTCRRNRSGSSHHCPQTTSPALDAANARGPACPPTASTVRNREPPTMSRGPDPPRPLPETATTAADVAV